MTFILPQADWRVMLGDRDLRADLEPRLCSLTLTDKRAGEADELQIVLSDHDGRLELPRTGVELAVQLGWKRGSDVQVGLVGKGTFRVDEVTHAGPPDLVTIRARAADFTGALATRRERSWHDVTIGDIVSDIAGRHGLQARCAPALASIAVPAQAQSRESDVAFLRRLGKAHDAIATIKQGTVLFAPIGAGTTAGGAAIPPAAIARREVGNHSFSQAQRDSAAGVSASWHDRGSAARHTVTVGQANGSKRLARVYASEANAKRAARAALTKAKRDPSKLTLNLPLGRADLYPERRLAIAGFKPEIDALDWLIVEVAHTLDGQGGFTSSLTLEAAP